MKGRLLALGSAFCFGTLGVFSKKAYDEGAGSFELLLTRVIVCAVVLGLVALIARPPLPRGRALAVILGMGVLQLGTSIGLLVGFDHAPAALIVLLFYAYPVLVTAGGALLYGEPFGRARIVVLVLVIAGLALTAGNPGSAPAVGIALGLLAACCTTVYFLGARYTMTKGTDPLAVTSLMYLAPSVALLAVAAARGVNVPGAAACGYALGVAVVGTLIPIIMVLVAIGLMGAGTTALLSTVEPFVAVVLAYLILGERLSVVQLVGGGLILLAVVVSALPQSRRLRAVVVSA